VQVQVSLRPAKTMPDCARNDDIALRFRISGCRDVTKLQHGIALAHVPGQWIAQAVGFQSG
jgi:hypothetical protein